MTTTTTTISPQKARILARLRQINTNKAVDGMIEYLRFDPYQRRPIREAAIALGKHPRQISRYRERIRDDHPSYAAAKEWLGMS